VAGNWGPVLRPGALDPHSVHNLNAKPLIFRRILRWDRAKPAVVHSWGN
jgi:hypothetical protein